MQNNYSEHAFYFCDALHNLVPFLQFKKRENTHGGMLSLSLHLKSNTLPWVFFMFFKLYKWYQIAQRITIILILMSLVLQQQYYYFQIMY